MSRYIIMSFLNLLPASVYNNVMSNLGFEAYLRLYVNNIDQININPELRRSGREVALPDLESYRLPLTILSILENYENGNDIDTKKFKIAQSLTSDQYVNYVIDDESVIRACFINDDNSITIIFPGLSISNQDAFLGSYGFLTYNTTKEFRHNSKVKINPLAELKYNMIRDKLFKTLKEISESMGNAEPEIIMVSHSIGVLYSTCLLIDNDFAHENVKLTIINSLPYLWTGAIANAKETVLSKTASVTAMTEILDNYRIILAGSINDSVDSFIDNTIFFSGKKILVNPLSKSYTKQLRYILEDRSILKILNGTKNMRADFHSISNLLNKLLTRKPVIISN